MAKAKNAITEEGTRISDWAVQLRPAPRLVLFVLSLFSLFQAYSFMLQMTSFGMGVPLRFVIFRCTYRPECATPGFEWIPLLFDLGFFYLLGSFLFSNRRLALFICLFPILFLPFQRYLADNLYGKVPGVNLCYLSYGYGDGDDLIYPIRSSCFSSRAHNLLDPGACRNVEDPGFCIGSISRELGEFHCPSAKEDEVKDRCLLYLKRYALDFHSIVGVEEYIEHFEATYNLNERYPRSNEFLVLKDDGTIVHSFDMNLRISMYFDQNNSLILHGYGPCDSIGGSQEEIYRAKERYWSMYFTDCSIINNLLTVKWFEYHFEWGDAG
jgi:hypothetical protein